MHFFTYRSTACINPGSPSERELIARSQSRNAARGLSGFLYREGDLFLQYLEGSEAALRNVRDRIVRDSRHRDVVVLGEGLASRSYFIGWPFGFCTGIPGTFAGFLHDAWGKTALEEATSQDIRLFLGGMSQRYDLGLTA